MEATSLLQNLAPNLLTIQQALHSNIPLQKTALPVALPIELAELAQALHIAGCHFELKSTGTALVEEFISQYNQQSQKGEQTLEALLNDKRTTVWVEGIGTVLLKEVIIRRLEYINEAAALLDTMMVQSGMSKQRVLEAYNETPVNPNKTYRKKA